MSRGNLRAIDALALKSLQLAVQTKTAVFSIAEITATRQLLAHERPLLTLPVHAETPYAAPWLVRDLWSAAAVGVIGGGPKSCLCRVPNYAACTDFWLGFLGATGCAGSLADAA